MVFFGRTAVNGFDNLAGGWRRTVITLHVSFTPDPDSADTGTLRCAVTDTGIGISEEDQKKLTEPFVQLSGLRGTNAINNGTGLGLSIHIHIIYIVYYLVILKIVKNRPAVHPLRHFSNARKYNNRINFYSAKMAKMQKNTRQSCTFKKKVVILPRFLLNIPWRNETYRNEICLFPSSLI